MVKVLSAYYLWLGRVLRWLYFSRVDVRGEKVSTGATLFIISHRNGAVDGFVSMAALGDAPSLISIQLLRKWFLRVFFTGIAVVREKDCQRYGIDSKMVKSSVVAGFEQIQGGGRLCVYPEGTSAWGEKSLSYHTGMAVIAARLKQKNVAFVVQPVGLFYSKPDGFRSRASIIVGKAFVPVSVEVDDIQMELSGALDAVSVNCHSHEQFNQVQSYAWQACQRGQDFGEAFLHEQRCGATGTIEKPLINAHFGTIPRQNHIWAKCLFMIGFPLVVLSAKIAGRASDGRNNLSFFHLLGAVLGVFLQILLWLLLCFYVPASVFLFLLAGVIGWFFYPEPFPIDL